MPDSTFNDQLKAARDKAERDQTGLEAAITDAKKTLVGADDGGKPAAAEAVTVAETAAQTGRDLVTGSRAAVDGMQAELDRVAQKVRNEEANKRASGTNSGGSGGGDGAEDSTGNDGSGGSGDTDGKPAAVLTTEQTATLESVGALNDRVKALTIDAVAIQAAAAAGAAGIRPDRQADVAEYALRQLGEKAVGPDGRANQVAIQQATKEIRERYPEWKASNSGSSGPEHNPEALRVAIHERIKDAEKEGDFGASLALKGQLLKNQVMGGGSMPVGDGTQPPTPDI